MDFNFSPSTSLYFYSALLQGNASLVALVAVFLVYRRQFLDASFDRLEKIIINYLEKTTQVVTNYSDIYDMENYCESRFQNIDDIGREKVKLAMKENAWKIRFKELKSFEAKEKELWEKAKFPIASIFVILMASIFLLPLSDLVHKHIWLEGGLFFVFVISENVTLIALFKFIRGQLRA